MARIQDPGYYTRFLQAIQARAGIEEDNSGTSAPADVEDAVVPVLVINGLLTPPLDPTKSGAGAPTIPWPAPTTPRFDIGEVYQVSGAVTVVANPAQFSYAVLRMWKPQDRWLELLRLEMVVPANLIERWFLLPGEPMLPNINFLAQYRFSTGLIQQGPPSIPNTDPFLSSDLQGGASATPDTPGVGPFSTVAAPIRFKRANFLGGWGIGLNVFQPVNEPLVRIPPGNQLVISQWGNVINLAFSCEFNAWVRVV